MLHRRPAAIALAALLVVTLPVVASPTAASGSPSTRVPALLASEPNQVKDLKVTQGYGFATLSWTHVDGATDYQIERTPVGADDVPTGNAVITGLWRPNRQVNNESPTFADAGFNPGLRFQWRVRARFGTTEQPYSTPVSGTTQASWGDPNVPGESLRTQWETTQAVQYTSDVNEYAYTTAIDELSDRMRVVEIGRTLLDRPINMMVFGYPTPPATPEAIAATSPVLINCNVHGNEPGDREACLILARQLAFSQDRGTIDVLSNSTVLIVPTINGDGRAANTRGNNAGQDLNRDYSLIRQPETLAFVKMLQEYRPIAGYDGHEYGNSGTGDLPMLPPRHQNVAREIFDESMNMIEGHMYEQGATDGWWACPYGCTGASVGLGEETILRNTLGLKNVVNSLLELRSSGGATRPDEGNTSNNRRRKGYSALWTFTQFLDYHRANHGAIRQARGEAIKLQSGNTGRIVFRGSHEVPAHPAPHPGETPPPVDAPRQELILDNAPCAYRLTEEQYNGERTDGAAGHRTTVAQRLAAHGWRVVKVGDGYFVPLTQPERGLIPLLLDGTGVERMVAGERVYPTVTGRHNGPLRVNGFTCVANADVNGPVNVAPGAALVASGSSFNGPITAAGSSGLFMSGNTVRGPIQVTNVTDAVSLIDNRINGPVNLVGNRAGGNAPFVAANTIQGPLNCAQNTRVPTNLELSNSVAGPRSGQCAGL